MTRPSETTRHRLLEEGIALFLIQGYHGTGIKQVLDQVKVPKGSFYNYFKSKEDFVAAAILHYADCFGGKMKKTLAGAPDPLTGLRGFFETLMKEFVAGDYVGGCLIANLGGELEGSDVCRETLSLAFRDWRNMTKDALRQCQQLGLVRSDVDAGELADLLTESWEGAVIRMKLERSIEPLHRVVNRLLGDYFMPK
jgi:TetR/AcrR family transcriptional regulator, transcriptional repressor for nem operon